MVAFWCTVLQESRCCRKAVSVHGGVAWHCTGLEAAAYNAQVIHLALLSLIRTSAYDGIADYTTLEAALCPT